jgi:ABC-type Mn2+/Zn2+ transport system permease subunit
MSLFVEMVSPSFLLRDALVGSVLVGAVCPLIGVYFMLRRMIFLGVALPQLSAAGIARSPSSPIAPSSEPTIGSRSASGCWR